MQSNGGEVKRTEISATVSNGKISLKHRSTLYLEGNTTVDLKKRGVRDHLPQDWFQWRRILQTAEQLKVSV